MESELKDLLNTIASKLVSIEKRLEEVEKKSHDQITLEDYFKKYSDKHAFNGSYWNRYTNVTRRLPVFIC